MEYTIRDIRNILKGKFKYIKVIDRSSTFDSSYKEDVDCPTHVDILVHQDETMKEISFRYLNCILLDLLSPLFCKKFPEELTIDYHTDNDTDDIDKLFNVTIQTIH